jgi:enterochelin esterase family protein
MKKKYFVLLMFAALQIFAQTEFQSFINHVNSLPANDKLKAVDSFMVYARSKGIPFIEKNYANFIYRGNVSRVQIAGDMTGWSPHPRDFTKLSGTDFFYFTNEFELNARLDYKLIINSSQWILDPENPHRVSGGFGPNSELAMPEYIQPWEINYRQNIKHGSVSVFTFSSKIMKRNYLIKIYLPPDYLAESNVYPTAYFQDGSEYISLGSAVNVIDNLIDSNRIEKVIGVFVTPTKRQDEYAENNRYNYTKFFAEELVPHIDSLYRTEKSPDRRIIIGDSWGGNISALISWLYPELFAKCGLHSAAFWPNNYEVYNFIINGDKKNISYFSVYGSYESLYENMRNFYSLLKNKSYDIQSYEFPEGHSWGLWRANIDRILEYFIPSKSTSTKEEIIPTGFNLYQNFPNPFNPSTEISYSVSKPCQLELKIFNLLGEEIVTLTNGFHDSGYYRKTFSFDSSITSGIYFYRLTSPYFSATKKMVVLR